MTSSISARQQAAGTHLQHGRCLAREVPRFPCDAAAGAAAAGLVRRRVRHPKGCRLCHLLWLLPLQSHPAGCFHSPLLHQTILLALLSPLRLQSCSHGRLPLLLLLVALRRACRALPAAAALLAGVPAGLIGATGAAPGTAAPAAYQGACRQHAGAACNQPGCSSVPHSSHTQEQTNLAVAAPILNADTQEHASFPTHPKHRN